MNTKPFISDPTYPLRIMLLPLCLILVAGLAGCSAKYGSFQRDEEVFYAFENNQVNTEYKYFSNHHHNVTYAIVGIDPKYKLESKFWREVEPNTEEFNKLVSRIWEDLGYYSYGADIMDPAGNKVGIYFSAVLTKTVKFGEDNQIEIIINTPYLWGPSDPGDIRAP